MSSFFFISLAKAGLNDPICGTGLEDDAQRGGSQFAVLDYEPRNSGNNAPDFNLLMHPDGFTGQKSFDAFAKYAHSDCGCKIAAAGTDPATIESVWSDLSDSFSVNTYEGMEEFAGSPDNRFQVMFMTIFLPSGERAPWQPGARYVLFARDQGLVLKAFLNPVAAYHAAMVQEKKEHQADDGIKARVRRRRKSI
ncbi:hypothetical protein [Stenotrophomonas sp. 364]|uniref:hypothetical protein n=1 Tax=Stenotrophomonas sp. 364 TaxID=2691571 RepID=UPI0013185A8D|nr:hypothetical protein [Stenotrophomonas sp. 364]QHB70619.1 hypothetical protein GQ674_04480 [Stenotrophomonas sp. 364]